MLYCRIYPLWPNDHFFRKYTQCPLLSTHIQWTGQNWQEMPSAEELPLLWIELSCLPLSTPPSMWQRAASAWNWGVGLLTEGHFTASTLDVCSWEHPGESQPPNQPPLLVLQSQQCPRIQGFHRSSWTSPSTAHMSGSRSRKRECPLQGWSEIPWD